MTRSHFYNETSTERAERVKDYSAQGEPGFKLLIVGCGMIGREHMRVTTLLGRARIHGVYDVDANSISLAQEEFAKYSAQPFQVYQDLQTGCADP